MRIFLAVSLVLAFYPSLSFADGIFVWENEDIDIHEPQQKAFIAFDQGIEDLVLEVKFEGAPDEFGWLVPLPSYPTVTKERFPDFPW